jgi:hypothetical protein
MQIEGAELLAIISRQETKFSVLSADGKFEAKLDRDTGRRFLLDGGGYFGEGNRHFIRYIRPVSKEMERTAYAGRSDDSGQKPRFARARPGKGATKHTYAKGAMEWKEHQSNANTGHAGGDHQMFLGDPLAYSHWVRSGRTDKWGRPILAEARKMEV